MDIHPVIGDDMGNMIDPIDLKPGFMPIVANILDGTYLFHCPDHIHNEGKSSRAYRSWYAAEYNRHVRVLGSRGHPRAMCAIRQQRVMKTLWMKRRRQEQRMRDARIGEELRDFFLRSNEADVFPRAIVLD